MIIIIHFNISISGWPQIAQERTEKHASKYYLIENKADNSFNRFLKKKKLHIYGITLDLIRQYRN